MPKPTVEYSAITAILDHMKKDGWTLLEVNDSEEVYSVHNVTATAVMHVTDVDEATVILRKGDLRGWIFFVLGNSPEEVICDYTTNLDPHLSKLTDPWFS